MIYANTFIYFTKPVIVFLYFQYINAMAEGGVPPGQYYHLARTTSFTVDNSQIYGSKVCNLYSSIVKSELRGLKHKFKKKDIKWSTLKKCGLLAI